MGDKKPESRVVVRGVRISIERKIHGGDVKKHDHVFLKIDR